MLEYELNGKIYAEDDLIKAAGGKDKLPAYIKSKGYKAASRKKKQPAKLDERFGEDVYKKTFGFENPKTDSFSDINKTKKKATAKNSLEIVRAEDISQEESTSAKNLGPRLAKYGLTLEETGLGTNRLTVRGANKNMLGKRIDQYGEELDIDLDPVAIGPGFTKKELTESAKRLNEYIKLYGDKDYIQKVKKENPKLIAEVEGAISPASRTEQEKLSEYNKDLDSEFKDKETIKKNGLGIKGGYEKRNDIQLTEKDFDSPTKYNTYKSWKKTGQIPLPSTKVLEAFIGEKNDNYRAVKSSELMSDASQDQRTAIQALETERKEKGIQSAKRLESEGIEIDKVGKAFSEKTAKFEKTPPTPQELEEYTKEYYTLQNRSSAYNKEILSLKKDFNNIKAVSEAASKDYSRLNQTGSLLKQTALGLVGGIVDIGTTLVAASDVNNPVPYKIKKDMLKETLLDPIYAEQKAASAELESYQRDLQIKDIKSMKDLGRWGASVLTQMPSSMALAVTGEAALPLFFLSGYGSKQYEIANSQETALSRLQFNADQISKGLVANEDMSEIQKQIASDKKTLNLSEGAKLTSQVLAGAAEVLFEKYGTLGLIKETNNILRAIPKEEIQRQLKFIGKEMGKSVGVESWTEGLTQFANNFGDIHLLGQDKNYFEGVPDAMAGGAFMGPGFVAMGGTGTITNNITKSVVSELATKEEFKARDKKLNEIKKLTGLNDVTGLTKAQLNKLTLQAPVKKAVEELIDQMDGEDLRILDRLGKDFSMEDAKKVGDFNQKLRKITKDWNEASRTSGIDDAQLKSLKDHYQKQYNETFEAREALLKDDQLIGKNKKDNAKKRINFEATLGSNLYKRRLIQKTYFENLNNFDKLSSNEKKEYNDLALLELTQDTTIDQLSNEVINDKARQLYAGKEINDQIDRDIKAANDFSTEMGLNVNVEVINSEKELLKKYGNIIPEAALKELKKGRTNAFNIDDSILVVYKPNAIKNAHTSTGSHELLHTVLSKAFKNKGGQEEANKNGIKLLEYLKTAQPSLYAVVEERMKAYTPDYAAYGEEVFNALSDSFSDGKIPNDSAFAQISKFVNKITKGALGESETFDISNIDTDSGKALFNTIKAYNQKAGAKKTKIGQNIRFIYSDTEDKITEGTPTTGFKASKTKVAEVQKKIDNLEDQLDKGEIDYEDYESRLEIFEADLAKAKLMPEEALKPEVKKVEVSEEEADKEIIKNERSSLSSDKVQKIYDEKGLNGAQDIIDLFKPITKKLVNRRMDAPGFDRELLTDEIETGTGGILDLISKYKPESGIPLAAFINKYLPVRAIAASRRVLDKDFSKDVTEEKGLIAEETASETKEKPKYKNALESNVFEPDVLKTLSNKIISVTRTLKNRIDAPITLNRTVTPLISEIRDEVGRLLDIDVKTAMGGKKDDQLKKWLLKNKRYVLENMTTTWLMGKDGVGGMPQAIQKQIDGKWVSYPDWVGKKIDREKTTTDQAGRTSGAELVRRLPNVNNNIPNEVYLSQVLEPSGNPIRGRKESLAKAVAEESAFDIINNDLENEGPIFEALSINQERLGYEVTSAIAVEIARQVERGNIKFSKTNKLLGQAILNLDSADRTKLFFKGGDIEDAKLWNDYDKVKSFVDIFNKLKDEETEKLVIYNTIAKAIKQETKDNKKYKPEFTNRIKETIPTGKIELANGNTINITNKDVQEISPEYIFKPKGAKGSQKFILNEEVADNFLKMAEEFVKFLPKLEKSKVLLASVTGIGYMTTGEGNQSSKYVMEDGSLLTEKYTNAWENITKNGNLGKKSTRFNKSGKEIGVDDRIIQISSVQNQVNTINNSKEFKTRLERIKELEKWLQSKNYIKNKEVIQDFYNSLFLAEQDFLYDAENKEDYLKRLNFLATKARLGTYLIFGARQLANLTHIEIVDKKSKNLFKANIEHVAMPHVVNSINLFKGVANKSEQAPPINNTMSISSENRLALDRATGTLSNLGALKILAMKDAKLAESLVSIDELSKGKIVTLKDQIGNISFDVSAIIDNNNKISAINSASTIKYSKTPKGISVFDFDDTTGITKGSVLYTMPDGSKGKLNAEEFAKEGSNLLAEGAVFDFSEFSKVVDGKPGPMVEKMKKMIGKFGPENFFILTARPPEAAGPIHEFLSSIGIDIPLENITGLGNSTAQAKADWMTAKAAEGYNDFYFADDAPQNVEAVKKALNIPGVDSKVQQAMLKFSLSTEIKLDWKTKLGQTSANFKMGEYTYNVKTAPIKNYGLSEDPELNKAFKEIAGNFNIPLERLTTNPNFNWVSFAEENMGTGILGTGNAFKVFGVVTNGLVDYIQKNNIEGVAFNANTREPSRVRLYKTLASTIGARLGWSYSIVDTGNEEEGTVFVVTSSNENPFKNQSKQVKDALNVVDIKSTIQQAKIKFSKTMSDRFNQIIEENKGVEGYKVFSDITARRRGINKNKFDFYVPPSAADFELLLYKFMGKGTLGEEQKQFFEDALIKPYINGVDMMDAVRQSIKKEYKALLKSFLEVKKELEKLTPNKDFTYDQAMRVAIWSQYETEIPGLSKRDTIYLTDLINNDPDLAAFKDGLIVMGRQKDGWLPPGTFWDADTIISDLYNITEGAGRKKFLGEFIENTENIFGKWEEGRLVGPNINKVEAVYGTNVREALEDSIYRMINGKNRSYGGDKETAAWSSWVNGSTGAIMFLNTRSAALQMLGAVNFLNWRDNNPFNAGKAFLNQPQYWKDFARIWNSDKLKERRGGLREDVASAEIANAAANSKNKAVAVTSYLLKIGYTPTQLADSFAIAMGGAPFYRNRIKSYLKEGLTEQEAESKAWQDFSKISDETQQSGDPKDISKQQSSGAGRLLLVFQNFTMQQSRIVKKAALDLKNGRGDAKTNISKIVYYLAVQNILFSTLQQGLFAVAFDDDDDEEKKAKNKKTGKEAAIDVGNGVLDSILRGTGFVGGIAATLKNTVIKYFEEREKKQKAEYAKVLLETANMSPPIGSKFRKIYGALQATKYNKDLIDARGWGVMQDGRVHLGPMYSITGSIAEAGTNFPMDRLVNKVENISQAFNSENTAVQRLATGMGYSPWTVGIEETKGDLLIKATGKAKRKEEGWEKSIITREENKNKLRDSLDRLSPSDYSNYLDVSYNEKIRKADKRRAMLDKLNANK